MAAIGAQRKPKLDIGSFWLCPTADPHSTRNKGRHGVVSIPSPGASLARTNDARSLILKNLFTGALQQMAVV